MKNILLYMIYHVGLLCCRDHSNGYELCNRLESDKKEYFSNFNCDINDFYLESSQGSIYLRKLNFGKSDTVKVLLHTAINNLFPGCASVKKLQTNNAKRFYRNVRTDQIYNVSKSPTNVKLNAGQISSNNAIKNQTQPRHTIFAVAANSELSTAQAIITNRLHPQNVTSGARQISSNNTTRSQTQPHATFAVTMILIAPSMHSSAALIAKNPFIDINTNQNDNTYKNYKAFGVLFGWIVHYSENVYLIPALIVSSTMIVLFLGGIFMYFVVQKTRQFKNLRRFNNLLVYQQDYLV